jgi:hypothetical protein
MGGSHARGSTLPVAARLAASLRSAAASLVKVGDQFGLVRGASRLGFGPTLSLLVERLTI